MTLAEKVLTALPVRGKQAELAARIEDRHALAKRALGYVELYGAYTETDARYRVDRLMTMWDGLDAEDHEEFCFDPGVIDWDHYVHHVHLPSVIEHTRVRTTPGKSVVASRPERARKAILSGDRHLAVFDLEHTLMASNVVDTYAWLASRHLPPGRRARFVADLVRQAPALLALDRRDRGDFLVSFYRKFEDAPLAQLQADSWELFHQQLLTKSFPEGFARVRAHRALGHRTLLITGALDFIIEPVRPLFDDIVCAHMDARNGRLTGHLTRLPPIGEARALVLTEYADEHSLSLEESVAYADSASDLAMLEAVGFPVAVNPEVPPGRHRPAPRVARRTLVQGRRRFAPPPADRALRREVAAVRTGRPDRAGLVGASGRSVAQGGDRQMSTLLFERSLPRFAAARIASSFGSGRGAGVGPLRLLDHEAPALPGDGWVHIDPLLSGICGSDLATLDGRSSRYFEDIVSFPFVPGHEVVGLLSDDGVAADGRALPAGTRVVLQPVLGCAARGIEPPCAACAAGHVGNCERVAFGHIRPGLQTGYCADTGGGWSTSGLVAHASQLFPVPEGLSDADAVTVEPVACAVHAVLGAGIRDDDVVAVLGAGTLGLTVIAALTHLASTGRCPTPRVVLVGAKYAHQQRLARAFGATEALPPVQLPRAVRRSSHSLSFGGDPGETVTLSGGADVVLDCVGSAESIAQSLAMVRPRGSVALVGMPGKVTVDLAPLWHREVRLAGAYAYGTESDPAAGSAPAGRAVGAAQPTKAGSQHGRQPPGRRRFRPSTCPSRWLPRRRRGHSSRPPTPWPASRRPWPMPARPGAAAPSRLPST